MSLNSFNSGGLIDAVSEPEQVAGKFQDKLPFPECSDSLDLLKASYAPETVTSVATSIDLFQLPEAKPAPSIDLFHPSFMTSASSTAVHQPSQTSPVSSLDFFEVPAQPQPSATSGDKSQEVSEPKNEGWATFDTPHSSGSIPGTRNLNPTNIPSIDGGYVGKPDLFSSLGASTQWPSFQDADFHVPSTISSPWHMQDITAPTTTSTQVCFNMFLSLLLLLLFSLVGLGRIKQSTRLAID